MLLCCPGGGVHAHTQATANPPPPPLSSLLPTTGALKAYDKAIEIRRKAAAAPKAGSTDDGGTEGGQLSARLLNNAAVLHLRAGDAPKAYDLMAQAVAAAAGGAATDLDPLSQVGHWGGCSGHAWEQRPTLSAGRRIAFATFLLSRAH